MTTTNSLSRQRLQRLAEEAAALAEWTVVRDFANQVYGEGKAVKVEIMTYEHYDDENYSYELGNIVAHDKDGNELHYDHSLPYFSTDAWKDCADSIRDEDDEDEEYNKDFSVFKEISKSDIEKQRGDWVLAEDLPYPDDEETTTTYDLTRQPCLSLVTLNEQGEQ